MNVSLFPISGREIEDGFGLVISRFHVLESNDSTVLCDLGDDSGVIEKLLQQINASDGVISAVSGGSLLGDDGAGTFCTFLSAEEVAEVSQFFSSVPVRDVMQQAPEVLSGIIRGRIPAGYLEDLEATLIDLWRIYDLAAREALCVAQVYEG
ncbi:hypothetical protein [Streptomyces sp. NBC_00576]|uniref:hypothetical protein n=1 Tax=Streptomyces sp. NBC_00576 TaxID=2903665 RepID=UPI002E824BD0|nr:hypothetical protein [Streptomyces sp. NBC_00576]WUB72174.1 hypothetical protein OG734_19800 [Streptomyces sp. NBC_00576]